MTGHLAFVKTYFEEAALPRASRCQSIEGWLRILLSAADSLSLDQGRQHRQTPVHSNRPRQARPDQSHTSWYRSLCWKFPEGPVIDVSSLDEGTLILRKELFDHFLHKDQPWIPVAIKLDFTAFDSRYAQFLRLPLSRYFSHEGVMEARASDLFASPFRALSR